MGKLLDWNKKYCDLKKIILNYIAPYIKDDEKFIRMKWNLYMDYPLNLENPTTYNEKLQWLKLHDRKPEYAQMVDKYEAKKYVAGIIGEDHVIPTIAVYERAEDIDFDYLPDQFVLKLTHDSGGVIICKNKAKLNRNKVIKVLNRGLKREYYWQNREWPYKDIKPRIIAEKYMVDESGTELKDYKIFCFNGEPKIVQVDYDRFVNHKRNLYDLEWNRLPFTLQFPTDWNREIPKPEGLREMLDVAKKFSKGIPHVRVDLYHINGKIYFGELTFFHGSGLERFYPSERDKIIGDMVELPPNLI